ncbi:unnamed protein product [Ambrosiozyma monospora]|uniref:Unnamed protein product n=1 Tax=Ambrosiozyma monospora TaxID=43982 RepID=A0A9W6YUX7_AMBMO|nr:unnamed protein product [Ambrosiozyma monospora]
MKTMNFSPLIILTLLILLTSGKDSSKTGQTSTSVQSKSVGTRIAEDESSDSNSDSDSIQNTTSTSKDSFTGSTLSLEFPTEMTTATNDTVFLDFYPVGLNYSIVYQQPILWTTFITDSSVINDKTISTSYHYYQTIGGVLVTTTLNQYSTITQTRTATSGEVGHNSLKMAATPIITSNVQDIISCGMKALVYDFYLNSTSFDEFITQNSNESYVQSYMSVLSNYQDRNIAKNSSIVYSSVVAGHYNFIFQLPVEKKLKLIDYMGYCYMELQTGTKNLTMTEYTSNAYFTHLFKFGYSNTWLFYTTGEDKITSEYREPMSYWIYPVFPTLLQVDLTAPNFAYASEICITANALGNGLPGV